MTVTVNAKSKETGEVSPVTFTYTIPAIEGAEPIVETTAAPTTTVPETTAEPTTTVPETTVAATTKAPTTTTPATPAQATPSQPSNNGTVKTGEAVPAVAVLLTLVAGVGVIYFYRRKYSK